FVGGLIHFIGQLLQLWIAPFTRQPLKLAGGLAGLVHHLLLLATAAATALIARPLLHSLLLLLQFLLHTARQLFQVAFGLVVLLGRLLFLFTVERLVLVLHLVQFQLKQIGQFLCVLLALALRILAHRDGHFAEDGVGALQLLQRFLFVWLRFFAFAG